MVENPAQTVRERESLNENWIAISTGTIAQAMYSQVMIGRNRGRPHGLNSQPLGAGQHPGRGGVGRFLLLDGGVGHSVCTSFWARWIDHM